MSFLNGFCSRYLRAAGVDASVVCTRSEGFWTTPRRALLIGQGSSPLLGCILYLQQLHRACKCTVTTRRRSRARRHTSAAGTRFALPVLGRSRTSFEPEVFPSHSVHRACKCTVNNAPTVADAETHACCYSSFKSSGFLPQPNCLSLYLRFVALSRSYLRVRGQCARAPLV